MKVLLAALLLSCLAFAQDQTAISAAEAACGPKTTKFEVTPDTTQHPTPTADSGKALVYVVQDFGQYQCQGCVISKVGLDGEWAGANKGNSYIFFTVEPGEHHLCLNWQSRLELRSRAFAVADLTAEVGRTYYFRARTFSGQRGIEVSFDLDPINGDQGKLLVAESAYSNWHVKK